MNVECAISRHGGLKGSVSKEAKRNSPRGQITDLDTVNTFASVKGSGAIWDRKVSRDCVDEP